jgi:hypothetical protein
MQCELSSSFIARAERQAHDSEEASGRRCRHVGANLEPARRSGAEVALARQGREHPVTNMATAARPARGLVIAAA